MWVGYPNSAMGGECKSLFSGVFASCSHCARRYGEKAQVEGMGIIAAQKDSVARSTRTWRENLWVLADGMDGIAESPRLRPEL